MDTTSVHLSVGGWRIKSMPSRLTEVDLARLRHADARPAGPPPAGPSPGALAASRCVEVDRLVNGIGGVTLGNRLILVGSPLAGQLVRQIPGDLIAAVPARDILAVTGAGVDGGVAVLNHAVRQVWESPRANRKLLLTPSLLIRQGTLWRLLES